MVRQTSPQPAAERARNGAQADTSPFDTVIVAMPDVAGRLVGKRLSARHFRESGKVRTCDVVFGWGIGHELLDGFASVGWEHGYGDVIGQPDSDTIRPLAWWPGTALVMADAVRPDGTSLAVAPRTVLRRQVEGARVLGYDPFITSELEFTVYAETQQSVREKGFAALALHREELHPELVETTGLDEELFAELRATMEASRILVESVKAEYSPSQFEMTLEPADALELADRHAVYKMGVRELCRRRGLAATFMAKPESDRGGQSCHLHISLTDGEGHNAFAVGDDTLMRRFVGGLQRYAADVLLLWAPYPNSYKRFRPGTFAPRPSAGARTTAPRPCASAGRVAVGMSRTASPAPTSIPTSRMPRSWPRGCAASPRSSMPTTASGTRTPTPAPTCGRCRRPSTRPSRCFAKASSRARASAPTSSTTSPPSPPPSWTRPGSP